MSTISWQHLLTDPDAEFNRLTSDARVALRRLYLYQEMIHQLPWDALWPGDERMRFFDGMKQEETAYMADLDVYIDSTKDSICDILCEMSPPPDKAQVNGYLQRLERQMRRQVIEEAQSMDMEEKLEALTKKPRALCMCIPTSVVMPGIRGVADLHQI